MASTAIDAAYTYKMNEIYDRLYVHGVAELPKADLLLWLDNSTKVTKKTWRNVQEGWNQRCKEEWKYEDDYIPTILIAYNSYTRMYILIWHDDDDLAGGGEQPPQPWFKPLTQILEKTEKEEEEE
jgi:hypothetical protein